MIVTIIFLKSDQQSEQEVVFYKSFNGSSLVELKP